MVVRALRHFDRYKSPRECLRLVLNSGRPALQEGEKLVPLGWGELSGSLAPDGSAEGLLDVTTLHRACRLIQS
jgi:hypothetical protein